MKLFKILFLIIFVSIYTYPQSKIIKDRPVFDVYAGLGNVSGVRVGGRILYSKHFSFESSIGKPISLLGVSADGIDLSFGINYHLLDKKNFTLSFIGAFTNHIQSQLKLNYLSPTAGIIIINKKGNHFFIRIGPYIEAISRGSFSKADFGLNIDLGYNFVF